MKCSILVSPRRLLRLGYVLETQITSGQSPSSVFGEFNRAAECPLSTLVDICMVFNRMNFILYIHYFGHLLTTSIFSGYNGLGQPSQSPPVASLSNVLGQHTKQVMTGAVGASTSPVSAVSALPAGVIPAGAAVTAGPSQHNKKYRPPHKTEKFTPKPIPPELGNLKTYSK